MKKVFVNQIMEENGILHGIAALDKTIKEDLPIIYPSKKLQILEKLQATHHPNSVYSFDRYCQFVVYLQYQPILGFSIKLSDYKNNIDAALDEYSILRGKGWLKEDIDKIMTIFQDIKDNPADLAEMITKDPVP